jgi:hypothetical protein
MALYGAETWTLRKIDIHLKFWTGVLENGGEEHLDRSCEVVHRVKEEMNVLRTIKQRKANWISHILRRNCLLSTLLRKR